MRMRASVMPANASRGAPARGAGGRRKAPRGAFGKRYAELGIKNCEQCGAIDAPQRAPTLINIARWLKIFAGVRISPYAARPWYGRARVRYAALINMKGYEATVM